MGSRFCPVLLLLTAREAVPTYTQCFPGTKEEGPAISCCFPGQGPLQHFDTCRQPALLGMRCVRAHTFSSCQGCFSLSLLGPVSPAPIWDQSATWDHGLGPSGDPSSAFLGQADTSPRDWMGWWCLKRKGTSVATCQGPRPYPSGPVQWAWGFPAKARGLR